MRWFLIFAAIVMGVSVYMGITSKPIPRNISAKMCEEATKVFLRSPSSYRSVEIFGSGKSVFLKYDAQNAFGTYIRGTAACDFIEDKATKSFSLSEIMINGRKPNELEMIAARVAAIMVN